MCRIGMALGLLCSGIASAGVQTIAGSRARRRQEQSVYEGVMLCGTV